MLLTKEKIFKLRIILICIGLLLLTKAAVSAEEGGIWPLEADFTITSYYGYRESPIAGASSNHKGIDISAQAGTPIMTIKSGNYLPMGFHKSNGNWAVIDHQDGTYSAYLHMQSFEISKSGYVNKGDIIGYVGSTGLSTGPHLHLEIRLGAPGRPMDFFLFEPIDPLSLTFGNDLDHSNNNNSDIDWGDNGNDGNGDNNINPLPNEFTYPTKQIYRKVPMMIGDDVKWIQKALSNLGYKVSIDGYYGDDTKKVVTKFQEDYGLDYDGVCDNATLERLKDPSFIKIEKDRYNVLIGNSVKLKVQHRFDNLEGIKLIWKSSNEKIAEVNQEGRIILKGQGKAIITCEVEDMPELRSETTVYSKPVSVEISKAKSDKSSVELTWKSIKGTSGYEIYRSNTKNGKYKKIETITNPKILTFTNKKLVTNKSYYFKIRAYYNIDEVKINGSWSKYKKMIQKDY